MTRTTCTDVDTLENHVAKGNLTITDAIKISQLLGIPYRPVKLSRPKHSHSHGNPTYIPKGWRVL